MVKKKWPTCGQGIAMAQVAVVPGKKVTDRDRNVNVTQGEIAFNGIGKESRG